MREWLEYAAAWLALKSLGLLPRPVARAVGAWLADLAYFFRPPLRRAAMSNLRVAFPEWGDAQRLRTSRQLVKHLGWMAGEFSQFPRYTRENIEQIVVLDAFEKFAAAPRRGKGGLLLHGPLRPWKRAT